MASNTNKGHEKNSNARINSQSVYNLVSNIPPGKVATYGQLASSVGNSCGARGIGKILNKNPHQL